MIKYFHLTILLMFLIVEGAKSAPSTSDSYFEDQRKKWDDHKSVQNSAWSDHADSMKSIWEERKTEIKIIWNELKIPSAKVFVDYSNDVNTRLEIDFENGEVFIDTISKKKLDLKSANTILKSFLSKHHLLLNDQIAEKKVVLKLTEKKLNGQDGELRNVYGTNFKLVPDHVKRRASKYIPVINNISAKHSLPRELIMAIMWQESAFNPLARSHIPAFGLMQIVPRFAGTEVKQHLGESVTVDGEFLYNPENNIRYGINYLSLLSEKYFSSINSFEKRAPFVIAGYNWGPSRLLKHIEKGRIKISSQDSIISQIQAVAPAETKDYLTKVFDKWNRIKNEQWLNN